MIEAMHPRRRFLAFADYLRARFGDRVQKVSLGHRLVCPWPEGPRECPFCQEARELDPNYGHGLPPHEHIRRSANFARGRGEEVRLMVMAHLPVGVSAPLDHVRSTFQLAMLQPGVVALTLNVVPEQLNDASEQALSSMQFSHASRSSAKPVTVAARFSQRARHVLWSYCEAKQSA